MPAHRSLPFEARNMVSQTSRSSRSISASLWAMAGSCPVHCLINAQAARYSLSRGTRYASPSYLAFRAHSRSVFSTPRTQAEILKTLVQQEIAEALATRDEFFFEPWFRSRRCLTKSNGYKPSPSARSGHCSLGTTTAVLSQAGPASLLEWLV